MKNHHINFRGDLGEEDCGYCRRQGAKLRKETDKSDCRKRKFVREHTFPRPVCGSGVKLKNKPLAINWLSESFSCVPIFKQNTRSFAA